SHELRTPLNAIIGFSDIIKQRLFGPLPARYAEYGDLIHESGEHLLELIGDVLDMSKIEADKYELTPEEFDARDVVSICAKMISPRAKDRGIALYCEPGDADLPVKADRKAMRQILLNLLSNAVKFTPEGGAVVVMARQDGAELVLAVGDSGVGIGEDELADLGKPYHQTRSGKETSERGTGLGLSLVQ
ncbi:MAG TPA: sensor histidine kinase, partial [Oceanicaulis sp.]|nr:sensor histidine kinase [Oceanicaulis sp.]